MKNIKTKIQKWVAENNAKILSERKKRFRQSQIMLKNVTDYAELKSIYTEVIDIYLGETSVNVYDNFGVKTSTKLYAEMACSSCGQLQFKIIHKPLDVPVTLWAPLYKWELQAEKHLIEEHSRYRNTIIPEHSKQYQYPKNLATQIIGNKF